MYKEANPGANTLPLRIVSDPWAPLAMENSMPTHPDPRQPPEATVGSVSARAATCAKVPAPITNAIASTTAARTLRIIRPPVVRPMVKEYDVGVRISCCHFVRLRAGEERGNSSSSGQQARVEFGRRCVGPGDRCR